MFVVLFITRNTLGQELASMQIYAEFLLAVLATFLLAESFFGLKSLILVNRDYVRITHPDFGRMDIRYERIGRVEVNEKRHKPDQMTIYGTEGEQLFSMDREHPRGLRFIHEIAGEIERRLESWRDRDDSSR